MDAEPHGEVDSIVSKIGLQPVHGLTHLDEAAAGEPAHDDGVVILRLGYPGRGHVAIAFGNRNKKREKQ